MKMIYLFLFLGLLSSSSGMMITARTQCCTLSFEKLTIEFTGNGRDQVVTFQEDPIKITGSQEPCNNHTETLSLFWPNISIHLVFETDAMPSDYEYNYDYNEYDGMGKKDRGSDGRMYELSKVWVSCSFTTETQGWTVSDRKVEFAGRKDLEEIPEEATFNVTDHSYFRTDYDLKSGVRAQVGHSYSCSGNLGIPLFKSSEKAKQESARIIISDYRIGAFSAGDMLVSEICQEDLEKDETGGDGFWHAIWKSFKSIF